MCAFSYKSLKPINHRKHRSTQKNHICTEDFLCISVFSVVKKAFKTSLK